MVDFIQDLSQFGQSEGDKALTALKDAAPKIPGVSVDLSTSGVSASVDVAGSYDALGNLISPTSNRPDVPISPPTASNPRPSPPIATLKALAPHPPIVRKGHHPMIFKRSGTAASAPDLASSQASIDQATARFASAAATGNPPSNAPLTDSLEAAPVRFVKGLSTTQKAIGAVGLGLLGVLLLRR